MEGDHALIRLVIGADSALARDRWQARQHPGFPVHPDKADSSLLGFKAVDSAIKDTSVQCR
jgi:hypothetical protein